MSASALLDRLDGVRATGAGTWIAKCPAHDDDRPSLSIRELDDGRVLVHDFAGCCVDEIVSAIGLALSDLFPVREIQHGQAVRRPFSAIDALRCVGFEALVVSIVADDVVMGKPLTIIDSDRVSLAAARIRAALGACGVSDG